MQNVSTPHSTQSVAHIIGYIWHKAHNPGHRCYVASSTAREVVDTIERERGGGVEGRGGEVARTVESANQRQKPYSAVSPSTRLPPLSLH